MGNKRNKKTIVKEDFVSKIEDVSTSFECDYCSFETMDLNVLNSHVANCCSADQPASLDSSGLKDDSQFVCPVCCDS